MPKIQEYTTEQGAAEPQGQISPVLEEAKSYGRGIADFGKAVDDGATVLNERQTQTETADAYSSVADQRQEFMERIQNAANSGDINDEDSPNSLANIKQDYQDWMDKQSDSYETVGGRNAFNRAASRAQGVLLQHGSSASTVVAGRNAADQASTLLNQDSNAVLSDPTLFDNLRDNQEEYRQSQVESGVWTPAQASKIKMSMDKEMSNSAVRGMMARDQEAIKQAYIANGDKVDYNQPQFNTAKMLLDGGHLDEFLDSSDKRKLLQEVKANQAAGQAAGALAVQQADNAKAAAGAKALSQAYEAIRQGNYDPKTAFQLAQKGLISPAEQLQLNKLSDAGQDPALPSNPRAFNDMMQRILSPDSDPRHISDPREMLGSVSDKAKDIVEPGSVNISHDDFQKLSATLYGAQGNSQTRMAEAALLQKARTAIGTGSDHQQFQLMQFTQAVQVAKQDALNNKVPLSSLFDPQDKNYVGSKLSQYVSTPQQIIQQGAHDVMRGGSGPVTNVSTKPGFLSNAWNTVHGYFSSAPAPVQAASAGAKPAPAPEAIGQMTMAQLRALDPKTLPPEAGQAASRRFKQLQGGR